MAGQRIDRYELLEEVGHGGMAVVYRARDVVLEREVAVKVLHAHLASQPESQERLRREALTVARLRHDNIVTIFDYSPEHSVTGYLVTEFIHGRTLRSWLESGWSPRPALAAMVAHRLCLALAHAHELEVVHRDIKPENVMVRDDGCVKLMDFGIAQIVDHQRLTMSGQLIGSPAYMAPELLRCKPVDERADLFSLGILLYQLATGQLPFTGRNPHEVLTRIADAEYTRASEVNPSVDDELEAIIARALAREPDDRYRTAVEFAQALEGYLLGLGLDPDEQLARSFFVDPAGTLEDLDRRVVDGLLGRAERELQAGNSARALRVVGRALELAPEHPRARAMLDRARQRALRGRIVVRAAAALAVVGFATAGVTLMRASATETSRPLALAAPEPDEAAPTGRARPQIPEAETPSGAGRAPLERGPTREPEGRLPAGTRGGEPEGAAENAAERGAGAADERPIRAALSRREPLCEIVVKGVPAAQLSTVARVVAGRRDVRLEQGRAQIKVPADGIDVELKLADTGRRYSGRVHVTPQTCASGSQTLNAIPAHATLSFTDLPQGVGPSELLVECIDGCSVKAIASKFKLELEAGQVSRKVTVELVTPGWRSTQTYDLRPGPNQVAAKLRAVG